MKFNFKIGRKTWAAILWLFTTLSLAGWWMYFSLSIIEASQFQNEVIMAQRRMLYWEGATWIFLLLTGGGFLIYYSQREQQKFNDYVKFISAYNHDAKTTLMNIMLQTERLWDSGGENGISDSQRVVLERLSRSVLRLRTQIENSLYLSNQKNVAIHSEKISLNDFIKNLAKDYPQLKFNIELAPSVDEDSSLFVEADKKGLESIFRNLIENAIQHGHATELKVLVVSVGRGEILTSVTDNGRGFVGNHDQLGKPFTSKSSASAGSGLGLYLVQYLSQRMNGAAKFLVDEKKRLVVQLQLRGSAA